MNKILAALTLLSFCLNLWQWLVARRFPLYKQIADAQFTPALTLLKPLKGADEHTEKCLRSWFTQKYSGPTQILFGAADEQDAVCAIVRKLLAEFPQIDAQLVICAESLGMNAKVSTLTQLSRVAKHEILVISDADVLVPPDFLANVVGPLRAETVGLVNCFYQLANPSTAALRCEAVAINADFWSQVLQSRSLAPLDFALGAVMATRQKQLAQIGGFAAIKDCLADDFQLGHRIAKHGHRIELAPVVVECWNAPQNWAHVWRHQLRWARTIRVSKPLPFFFSILNNATLWPLLWFALFPADITLESVCICLLARIVTALHLQWQLTRSSAADSAWWLVPVKDLLGFATWLGAFAGNRIEWRGQNFRLRRDGTLQKISA